MAPPEDGGMKTLSYMPDTAAVGEGVERRIVNRSYIKKFGLTMAEVTIFTERM